VVDIDLILPEEDLLTECRGVWMTPEVNWRTPVITRVCRESRNIAYEGMHEDDEPVTVSTDFGYFAKKHWFNDSTDIPHLNVSV